MFKHIGFSGRSDALWPRSRAEAVLSHHRTLAAALAIGALVLTAGTAAAHPPATVTCGQTLTHSVKLGADSGTARATGSSSAPTTSRSI